jgi:hypothetical protein
LFTIDFCVNIAFCIFGEHLVVEIECFLCGLFCQSDLLWSAISCTTPSQAATRALGHVNVVLHIVASVGFVNEVITMNNVRQLEEQSSSSYLF